MLYLLSLDFVRTKWTNIFLCKPHTIYYLYLTHVLHIIWFYNKIPLPKSYVKQPRIHHHYQFIEFNYQTTRNPIRLDTNANHLLETRERKLTEGEVIPLTTWGRETIIAGVHYIRRGTHKHSVITASEYSVVTHSVTIF